MRVGFELTVCELDRGGSARAAEQVRRWIERDPRVELVPVAHPGRPASGSLRRLARGLHRELIYFPIALPRASRRARLDLLHCPSPLAPWRAGVPVVMTAHDAIPWHHPEWLTRANALHARVIARPALRRAAQVITSSEFSRRALAECLDLPPERISVVPLGVDERFCPGDADTAVLERLGIARPYVLTVGTLQPRKNIEAVARALERLIAAGSPVDLVIAGARGWLDRELVELLGGSRVADRVHVTGHVGDDELVALYRGAECFVFPSRYEGFGLPPLEAMACGTPVISSDRTSLPEVVGDAGLLVDPDDSDAIERAIARVTGSRDLRLELRRRGLERAAGFTWRRCAEQTIEVYRRTLARAERSGARAIGVRPDGG